MECSFVQELVGRMDVVRCIIPGTLRPSGIRLRGWVWDARSCRTSKFPVCYLVQEVSSDPGLGELCSECGWLALANICAEWCTLPAQMFELGCAWWTPAKCKQCVTEKLSFRVKYNSVEVGFFVLEAYNEHRIKNIGGATQGVRQFCVC